MGKVFLSPNILAIIGKNDKLQNEVEEAANKILDAAKSIVPVNTGALQDSGRIEITEEGAIVVFGGGDTYYAVFVEFGTSDTPTFAFLRRGAEAAGYALQSKRR